MSFSDTATVSAEAFALFLLENYWESCSTKNLEEYRLEVMYDKPKEKEESNMGQIH